MSNCSFPYALKLPSNMDVSSWSATLVTAGGGYITGAFDTILVVHRGLSKASMPTMCVSSVPVRVIGAVIFAVTVPEIGRGVLVTVVLIVDATDTGTVPLIVAVTGKLAFVTFVLIVLATDTGTVPLMVADTGKDALVTLVLSVDAEDIGTVPLMATVPVTGREPFVTLVLRVDAAEMGTVPLIPTVPVTAKELLVTLTSCAAELVAAVYAYTYLPPPDRKSVV